MPRALTFAVAALVVVAASYGAVLVFGGSDDPPPAESGGVPALGAAQAAPVSGPDPAELDRLIGVFEGRIAERRDLTDLAFLGQLYLRKATINRDVGVYLQAVAALDEVLATWDDNWDAATALAQAQLAVHDFGGALATADRVLDAEPGRVDALAARGDALFALGDSEAAAEAYEILEEALPGHPAIAARLSPLAFLEGDVPRANALAAAAVEQATAAGLRGADLAWYHAARAELQLSQGRLDRAEADFNAALAADPNFAAAHGGIGHVRAAQGRYDESVAAYRTALGLGTDLGLFIELADVHALAGNDDTAATLYDDALTLALQLVEQSDAENRTLLMFYADHDLEPAAALRLAEADLAARQDVYSYDALSWALYRNGRFAEAREASERALALGTPEAEFWYHAGLISAALGDTERAVDELRTALDLNPAFNPFLAKHAAETLGSLQAEA